MNSICEAVFWTFHKILFYFASRTDTGPPPVTTTKPPHCFVLVAKLSAGTFMSYGCHLNMTMSKERKKTTPSGVCEWGGWEENSWRCGGAVRFQRGLGRSPKKFSNLVLLKPLNPLIWHSIRLTDKYWTLILLQYPHVAAEARNKSKSIVQLRLS